MANNGSFSRMQSAMYAPLLSALLFLAGCAVGGTQVDQAMQADKPLTAARQASSNPRYLVGCPDLLEIQFDHSSQRCTVGADGRIDLGALGALRVEGLTPAEIAQNAAEAAGVAPYRVRVQVVEYHSQQVYLFGEVTGLQRAVAYQGEETVADLLQRTGGITPGAAPAKVHVVRPRVAEGKPPLIYRVDLQAIVVDKDDRTNLRLQPFDQIHVSETGRSSLQKCIPPLVRPLYTAICGLNKKPESATDKPR